jgi:hypothetical protein
MFFVFCAVFGEETRIEFDANSNPYDLANHACEGKRMSCLRQIVPLIQLQKFLLFGGSLNWKYNDACG